MNEQKETLSRNLSNLIRQRAIAEIERRGTPLPGKVLSTATGAIVTVKLMVKGLSHVPLTMPVVGAEYDRLPIQVGDMGEAWPSVVYMGTVTGLGNPVDEIDLTPQFSLDSLLWVPVGSSNWAPTPDMSARVIYGVPNGGPGGMGKGGVILQDGTKNSSGKLTPVAQLHVNTDGVSYVLASGKTYMLTIGTTTVVMNNAGIELTASGHALKINASGISFDGKVFSLHEHTGVTTGPSVTGPVA